MKGRVLLAVAAALVTGSVLEAASRLLGLDIAGQERALARWPIFYRKPRVPVGEAFFARSGPDAWRGQVVRTALRLAGFDDQTWEDEPVVEVRYDADGFRNPPELRDWTVVVAGDSFVELGHLADAELYTALLGQRLGGRVKNLGVSFSGPLAAAFFLSAHGAAPSARQAVLVFYEGNDLADLAREERELAAVRSGAPRPLRETVPQSSLLKAGADAWRALPALLHTRARRLDQNAWFTGTGGRVPVSVADCGVEVSRRARASLDRALEAYTRAARRQGMAPFVAYMPCKVHALIGRLTDLAGAPIRPASGPLPRLVAEASERHGAKFVDLGPALRAEAGAGHLTYSGVFDTHLNARGSAVVARVLAEALSE
ncbi:MAG TPA: hypothetical protein VFM88_05680 [Vicinamibacteria bacterium]|nr:hypothetical protein [Vicinamibacteria bacterium]